MCVAEIPISHKRQQRSAQRLQEFQERKRAALVLGLVSKGADPEVARSTGPARMDS